VSIMLTNNGPTTILNKKFWEELICLLPYISNLFEILERNLMKLTLSELTLNSFVTATLASPNTRVPVSSHLPFLIKFSNIK
jgi:hypothetical protein